MYLTTTTTTITNLILGAVAGCDIIRNCFPPTSEREQNLVENTTTSRHIVMDDTMEGAGLCGLEIITEAKLLLMV